MGGVGVTRAIVAEWEEKWRFDGRLDPLDDVVRDDLIERINAAYSAPAPTEKHRRKKAVNELPRGTSALLSKGIIK